MVDPLGRCSGRKLSQVSKSSHLVSSQLIRWKIAVVVILGDTERSRVVTNMSPWISRWNLTVWTRWESHVQSQKIIREYQERGLLPLWVSRLKQGQRRKKARYAIRNVSKKDLSNIIREFDKWPYKSYDRRRPKNEPTTSSFYLARQLAKCMMRADSFNSHV